MIKSIFTNNIEYYWICFYAVVHFAYFSSNKNLPLFNLLIFFSIICSWGL